MNLPVPKLDTTDFERLVEDARALIPRYAPAWTDHNLHDPGITLIELLAWITDQEIYRLGFVGEKYGRAFAALLGASLQRAKPAHGLVWLDEGAGPQSIKADQRITSIEQPDVPFVLQDALFVSDAKLTKAFATDGAHQRRVDYLRDGSGVYVPRLPATAHLVFEFDRPLVPPLGSEVTGTIGLGIEVDPLPGIDGDAPQSWGPLAFDYAVGGAAPQRLAIVDDGTLALARTGVVRLTVPVAPAGGRPSTLGLRFDRGFFPIAPRIRRVALNVLPVVQLEEVPEKVLGRSSGLPDQTFEFDLARLPEDGPEIAPFAIKVDAEIWKLVADFDESTPDDPHVVGDPVRQRLRFGNGINGRIPRRDSQIRHAAFHATDGAAGNLGARLKWRLPNAATKVGTNLEPFTGGAPAWTINDQLRADMRRRATKRDALLTNGDLKMAVDELAGFAVARADVLVQHDPSLPQVTIRGARTLVVVPARNPMTPPPGPVPRAYLDALATRLAPRRLLGERFSVVGPGYVTVDLALRVIVAAGRNAENVRSGVEARIRARLSDLKRDRDVLPWPLGRPLTSGEIKGLAARVADVDAVVECRMGRAGAPLSDADIRLDPTEIAIAGTVDVVVTQQIVRRR